MSSDVFPELRQLARQLNDYQPDVKPVGTPLLVYGYVRTPESEPTYAEACGELLRQWATATRWELGAVFRDVGVGSSQLQRPGFTGLLDVLRLPEASLAVVVKRQQLSRKPEGIKQLTSQIWRTGASLRVLVDELAAPS